MRLTAAALLFALLAPVPAAGAGEPGGPFGEGKGPAEISLGAGDPKAWLVCVAGDWAVWQTSALIESTYTYRVRSYTHHFYRQRIGKPVAKHFHTMKGFRTEGRVGTVMPDGTFVLLKRGGLFWHAPDGTVTAARPPAGLSALYPDGGVVQKRVREGPGPVHFVPFKGRSLDEKAGVEVVPAGAGKFSRGQPLRRGKLFAWRKDSTLHVFDLATRKRTAVKLEVKLPDWQLVNAFDGRTAMCGLYAFDAKTGRTVGGEKFRQPPGPIGQAVAVRHRIAYYFKADRLMAADLAAPAREHVEVTRCEKSCRPVAVREGLRHWNGRKWVLIKWLEKLPASKK